jgi:hypothetical protein
VSIEELWAEMDMMDKISHGSTSTENVPRNVHRELANVQVTQIRGLYWIILLDHLTPNNEVMGEVVGDIPRKIRPHRFCPLPPELFLRVCEGPLLIGSIHL